MALAFPRSKRRPALSWWHHRQLAAKWITPLERDQLLERAEREKLTTRQLEAIVQDLRALHSDSRGATAACDELVEAGVRDLHKLACACFGPVTVEVLVRAPGLEYRVEVGE